MPKKKSVKKKEKRPSAPVMTSEQRGILILSVAAIIILSLFTFAVNGNTQNVLGYIGHSIGWGFHALLGIGSYFFALSILWIGWRTAFGKPINHPQLKALYASTFIISLCMLLSIIEVHFPTLAASLYKALYPQLSLKKYRFHLGGAPFYYFYEDFTAFNFHHFLGPIGTGLLFSSSLICSLLCLTKVSPYQIFAFIWSQLPSWPQKREEVFEPTITMAPVEKEKSDEDFMRFVKLRIPNSDTTVVHSEPKELLAIRPETNLKVRPSLSQKEEIKKEEVLAPKKMNLTPATIAPTKIYQGDYAKYRLPSAENLTAPKKVDQTNLKKDLRRQAEVLEETLLSFGIEAKVGQINCGPTITSFEVHPAIGVKVQKIKTLENDIALNMEAKSIRIIAPIPGKAAVGIEVPNAQPQEVSFKEILQAYQQGPVKYKIPILLGKAVNGDYVLSDLTKMPHCIIAGATGSGKSVCINTIVMSILMNAKPDEIKLVMVDPKKVELTPYSQLPHMLAPVITEPHGACAALKWLVKEMENRYDILKMTGARNIETFNNRTINKEAESLLGREIPERLPYIVGIVDELADLMMVSSNDIETPIARIAQMARAVGIHLILATQRPSREVITGLIKANFPTRISFKVASRVNSQIVLDEVGAESLLGNGDLLFLPPGASTLIRAQGAYIRDEDINTVVKSICEQAPPNYVINSFDRMTFTEDDGNEEGEAGPTDTLYEDALDVILSTGNASTTFLQRKLKIGYARAASIIDQMETRGVLGPAEGSKPRKILAPRRRVDEEEVCELLTTEHTEITENE